jgi:hypothetical protein
VNEEIFEIKPLSAVVDASVSVVGKVIPYFERSAQANVKTKCLSYGEAVFPFATK